MAYANTQTTTASTPNLLSLIARPFIAIGNFLVRISEASAMAQAVDRLAELSDEDLAAKGTTRRAEVEKLFGSYLYM